jgi:hypothetical protein
MLFARSGKRLDKNRKNSSGSEREIISWNYRWEPVGDLVVNENETKAIIMVVEFMRMDSNKLQLNAHTLEVKPLKPKYEI